MSLLCSSARSPRPSRRPLHLLLPLESRMLLSGAPATFSTGDDIVLLATAGTTGHAPPDAAFIQSNNPGSLLNTNLITGNIEAGTYTYTRSTPTSATIVREQPSGVSTLNLSFTSTSANSGTYTNVGADGSSSSGLFTFDSAPITPLAPASIVGKDFLFTITAGSGNLASSGSYYFAPAGSGNTFAIQNVSGPTVSTTGTYNYGKISSSGTAGEIRYLDASSFSSSNIVVFTSATSGLFYNTDRLNSSTLTDYQAGTFNVTTATSTALTSSVPTAGYGQSVTLSATVTPAASTGSTLTGSVTFYDGTTSLGTGAVNNGVATLKVSWLSAGSHNITANYNGDANFGPAASPALAQTINLANATVAATTLVETITSGTGVFVSSGKESFAFSATGNTYTRTVLAGGDTSGTGTYTYTPTGANSATINFTDSNGVSGMITLTFNGALTGTFHATARLIPLLDHNAGSVQPNLVADTQDGSFSLNAPVPEFRLYLAQTAEHLYTTDPREYTVLATRGWVQEGAAYQIFNTQVSIGNATAEPYYRLYNPGILQHLWTTDANEYNTLASRGWNQEGIIGYIFAPATSVAGSSPLYRLNINVPGNDLHLWTTDVNEYNTLASSYGWTQEGIIGYVINQLT